MKKRLNILSIDWDYFIDADMNTRMELFPDIPSEKYSKSLQNTIWASRYQHPDLIKIDINKIALGKLKRYLKSSSFNPRMVMIADSHRYCYEFVHSFFIGIGELEFSRRINLVNVDFHHDIYDNGDGIDCGNWLEKLIDDFPKGTYTWIHHSDADIEMNDLKYGSRIQLDDNLDHIKDTIWDVVFICRSSMWSPPHLDSDFESTFKYLDEAFNCFTEPGIFATRYNDELKQGIQEQKEILEQFRESNFPEVK